MPWHFIRIGGSNPNPKGRRDEVEKIVQKHCGTLEGFWYSYELTTAYALTKDPGDAAALARDLKAQQVIEMRGVDEVGS